jgi:hypothetical protein
LKSEFEQRSQNFSNSPGMPVCRNLKKKQRTNLGIGNKNFLFVLNAQKFFCKDKIYTQSWELRKIEELEISFFKEKQNSGIIQFCSKTIHSHRV